MNVACQLALKPFGLKKPKSKTKTPAAIFQPERFWTELLFAWVGLISVATENMQTKKNEVPKYPTVKGSNWDLPYLYPYGRVIGYLMIVFS